MFPVLDLSEFSLHDEIQAKYLYKIVAGRGQNTLKRARKVDICLLLEVENVGRVIP